MMNHESELTADVTAAIDACRHDSDDSNLPEVASVLARVPTAQVAGYRRSIERIDRAVVGSMQEVPVPEGLAERILDALHGDSLLSSPRCDQERLVRLAEPERQTEAVVAPHVKPARRRSRRFIVSGAALAIAASGLAAFVVWATRETLDAGDVLAQAKSFYDTDDHGASFSNDTPPVDPPVQGVLGWRRVTFLSRAGAAFELSRGSSGRRRVTGTLYVVPLGSVWGPAFSGLPKTPDPQGTSGMTVAVWSDDKHVYVMIVKGDEAAFRSFFAQKFA